jgi:hypothetical protein
MMRPYGYYDTGVQHQLGLDDEANSEIANGSDMGSSAARVTSVGDLPASSVSAVQLILQTMCSARTPPVRGGSDFSRFDPRLERPHFSNVGPPTERRPGGAGGGGGGGGWVAQNPR